MRLETFWQDASRGARAPAPHARVHHWPPCSRWRSGIGAVSAIFTVVNAVLLKPLPYQQPERRVMIWSRWTGFDKTWLSAAEWQDYRHAGPQRSRTWRSGRPASSTSPATAIPCRWPAPGSPRTRSTCSARHRSSAAAFTEAEDRPGHDNVVVLGYGLWQRRYAGDPTIVGRTILVDGTARTVRRRHACRLQAADRLRRGRGDSDRSSGGRWRSTRRPSARLAATTASSAPRSCARARRRPVGVGRARDADRELDA